MAFSFLRDVKTRGLLFAAIAISLIRRGWHGSGLPGELLPRVKAPYPGDGSITPTAPTLAPIRAESRWVPTRFGPERNQFRGFITSLIAAIQLDLDRLDLVLLWQRLPMINVFRYTIATLG
jgi:hypothetical protein